MGESPRSMQDMHSQMMELINKDQLLIYHNSMPDFTQQIKSPTFDKAVDLMLRILIQNIQNALTLIILNLY